MAQAVSSITSITNILKTWYTDKKFESLLFRNSPIMKHFEKNRIGGKAYNIGMLYGRGGATSGDYTVAVANSASTSQNAEMSITPGKIFSVFNLTQLAMLAGQQGNNTKANYVMPLVNLAFSATEGLRKTAAAAVYGSGYGELGVVGTGGVITTIIGSNTANMTSDVVVKLDIGTVFSVTNSGVSLLPNATLRTSVNTVTAIGSAIAGTTTYPVTFTSTAVETWTATDWIELAGSRDGSQNPNLPTGLGGWLPSYFNRTGSSWNTYIGTSFYGVTRSVATDRLAGNYYLRNIAGSEKYADAIMEGVRLCRRAGGVPDLIVLNDISFKQLLSELNQQIQYFQSVQDSNSKGKVAIQKGAAEIGLQFASTMLNIVIEDPYCPLNLAYILDSKVIEFAGLSKTDAILEDGIVDNEAGRPDVTTAPNPETNFKLVIDDWINVQPGSGASDGPSMQVTLAMYGNFVVRNPASCAVVQLF
jgi:hypothetical protein